METHDPFIDEANKALLQDACHNVRRGEDGNVEMFSDDGTVLITLSRDISIDDLVGVSTVIDTLWAEAFQDGERNKIKDLRQQINKLKAKHGESLTARHIEALIESHEAWYADIDKEEADFLQATMSQTG
jgi:hypothetical protein